MFGSKDTILVHTDSTDVLLRLEAATLCDWCSDILVDYRYTTGKGLDGHPEGLRTFDQLRRASLAACAVCSTVYRATCEYGFAKSQDVRFERSIRYKIKDDLPSFSIHECTASPPLSWEFELMFVSDMATDIHRRTSFYEPPSNSSDPAIIALVQAWMSNCSTKHTRCDRGSSSYRPPRLIEITNDRIRLVTTNMVNKNEFEAPYATLSHCWGTNPTFLTLTEQNLRRLHDRIGCEELPKTFQDAVLVCQRLGLRYLWIDSLCIIQAGKGSKEDWLKHVTEMRNVYRNCLVNIAASRATDATKGLYTERNPKQIKPARIDNKGNGSIPSGQLHLVHHTISEHGWQRAPLNTRGWVFQERLLSPRIIYWTSDQIFWQCSSLLACETYPVSWPSPSASHFAVPFELPGFDNINESCNSPQTQQDVRQAWRSLVHRYSDCRLSYPDLDKLPALVGVVEHFARIFDDVYVAGLFRRHLPEALLWTSFCAHTQNTRVSSGVYRCPSWSWAKLDTTVMLHGQNFGVATTKTTKRLAEVVDIKTELHDPMNAFGRLNSASLVLRAWIVPFRWTLPLPIEVEQEPHPFHIFVHDTPLVCTDLLGPGLATTGIEFDYNESAYEAQEDAFFMPIESDEAYNYVQGLMLRRLEREGQHWHERIGMVNLRSRTRGQEGFEDVIRRFGKLPEQDIILM